MRAGGAERVLANVMNDLAARGMAVRLATFEHAVREPFYPLDQRIEQLRLGHGSHGILGHVAALPASVAALRRTIRDGVPEVILSFLDVMNVPVLLAAWDGCVPVVVSERVDPAQMRFARARSWVRDRLYCRASAVVVQTTRVRERFPGRLQPRIAVIPNAVFPARELARPHVPGPDGRWRLLGVGRLDPQKGFDLLLEAFARVAGDFPCWDLVVHGDVRTPEHGRLTRLATRLGVSGRVTFAGLSERIQEQLARGHLMALPSRFEGFPNALAEAVAHGLPAVAFRGVSGIAELVEHRRNGLLVERGPGEVDAVARALAELMADRDLRATLGAAGPAIAARFAPERVHEQWAQLLAHALASRATT